MRWMSLLLGLALTVTALSGRAAIPDDPTKVTPVMMDAKAPSFSAREVDGRSFDFNPTALKSPVMLIFYRGGWCPYCNAHLQDLHSVIPKIIAMGYQVLFLSTDRPELLYSSLKERVDYHILSDSSMSAARAFGVAYRLDDATLAKMKAFGVDLDATQGTHNHELPVPSVFIVDRSGIVRFRHFESDFRVRLSAASVLSAAEHAPH